MFDRLKHIFEQPFVFATGLAALVHSTWSLGTLFSGEQPQADLADIQFWGWIVPAFLIAVALDIGQIATSSKIRTHGLTPARAITFGVFAFATYYLQWLYMAHHMPSLQLAGGVRADWAGGAQLIRDAALWGIPMLLPLSTLLYTFSDGTGHGQTVEQPPADTIPVDSDGELVPLPQPEAMPLLAIESSINQQAVADIPLEQHPFSPPGDAFPAWMPPDDEDTAELVQTEMLLEDHSVTCKHCGWTRSYSHERKATNALNAHMKHCSAANFSPFPGMESAGYQSPAR